MIKLRTFTLRRILKEDYGVTITSKCKSVLILNNKELTEQEEREILETLFASVPPILMQHTLRPFCRESP